MSRRIFPLILAFLVFLAPLAMACPLSVSAAEVGDSFGFFMSDEVSFVCEETLPSGYYVAYFMHPDSGDDLYSNQFAYLGSDESVSFRFVYEGMTYACGVCYDPEEDVVLCTVSDTFTESFSEVMDITFEYVGIDGDSGGDSDPGSDITASGTIGEILWYVENDVLVFEGEGDTGDFFYSKAPFAGMTFSGVNFPDSEIRIGQNVFSDVTFTGPIRISSLQECGERIFCNAKGPAVYWDRPDIPAWAFDHSSFDNVYLSDNVTLLYERVFRGFTGIIHLPSKPPALYWGHVSICDTQDVTFYVPYGSLPAYLADSTWALSSDLIVEKPSDGTSGVISITVSAPVSSLYLEDEIQFSATVYGRGDYSSDVIWSVDTSGISSETSISSDGLLTIGSDEACRLINIRATSVDNPSVYDTLLLSINPTMRDEPGSTDPTDPPTDDGTDIEETEPTIAPIEGDISQEDVEAGEQFKDDVSGKVEDFNDAMDDLTSIQPPDLSDIDTSVEGMIGENAMSGLSAFFGRITGIGLIGSQLFISLTLGLVSYIFFGKKG